MDVWLVDFMLDVPLASILRAENCLPCSFNTCGFDNHTVQLFDIKSMLSYIVIDLSTCNVYIQMYTQIIRVNFMLYD